MNTKLTQSLISGIAGTVVMTVVMLAAPMIGMSEMRPHAIIAGMMGMPIAVGWIMHFMIGIIFAASYIYLFNPKVSIGNKALKGAVFGIVIFIFAQIAMGVMGVIAGGMPEQEGSMLPMIIGSIVGHVIFGIVVALLVKESYKVAS